MDSEDDGFPKPGGEALEIGDDQSSEVIQFMNDNGYKDIESLKDLSHIERFVIATL